MGETEYLTSQGKPENPGLTLCSEESMNFCEHVYRKEIALDEIVCPTELPYKIHKYKYIKIKNKIHWLQNE